jgi:hypothetical protein
MCRYACTLLPVILLFVFVRKVSSIVCTKEELFGTRPLICPGPNDPRDKIYCCGPKKLRYCCSYADYASAINTIGIIVGVLVTAIVVVVIIVVVSCFCCSCCLLAKHRNRRGNTSYTASQPATTTTTATAHYSAQPAYPIQTFPTGYPQQHFQQQYPQQQFTQEHFQYPPNTYPPPQPPYPPAGGYQGGYPPPPGNPPPYPINDQPPYNPSFQ